MSDLNTQSPPTLDERLWAIEAQIKIAQEQLQQLHARRAALLQEKERRS